MKPSLVRI